MYKSLAAAERAYKAYLAITHTEGFMEHLRSVVNKIKAIRMAEDTTSAKIARRIVMKIKVIKKKKKKVGKKALPCPGSKIKSKGKGQGLGIGAGKGPIGRM